VVDVAVVTLASGTYIPVAVLVMALLAVEDNFTAAVSGEPTDPSPLMSTLRVSLAVMLDKTGATYKPPAETVIELPAVALISTDAFRGVAG
jgi:hypothetical protein